MLLPVDVDRCDGALLFPQSSPVHVCFTEPIAAPPSSLHYYSTTALSSRMMSVDMSEEDIYGQKHPIETPKLIEAKLKELEKEIEMIPSADKEGWRQAKQKCPELVDDEFKLMFLRCEVFNADLAALRLVKYWDKRIFLFGPAKAFLPLSLNQALSDDEVALSMGLAKLIPATDSSGRSMVFFDPSCQDKSKYTRESVIRALWYVMHVAVVENVEAQKNGILIIAYPRHAEIKQFDRTLMKMNMESIRGCLPIRISAVHICDPPVFFSIIWPIMKLFLGERLRKRVKVHSGSDEKVQERLAVYGITKDQLPSELGGNIVLDHNNWLFERKASDVSSH